VPRIQPERKLPDGKPGQPFDVAEVSPFLVAAQRDRYPGRTGARRPANTVNIVLRHVGQFEIDDMRHAFHIDPAGGDVGGHKHPGAAGAEAGERAFALGLRFVSVDGDRLDTGTAQMPHDPVCTVLCAGEHEHPFEGGIAQQCRQQLPFSIARDEDDALIHQLDCRRGRRYGHLDRVVEVLLGEGGNRPRHSRREQQCLTLPWQQRHDTPQGMDEAEVEHPIGLV
jgi:hypothetical protein